MTFTLQFLFIFCSSLKKILKFAVLRSARNKLSNFLEKKIKIELIGDQPFIKIINLHNCFDNMIQFLNFFQSLAFFVRDENFLKSFFYIKF